MKPKFPTFFIAFTLLTFSFIACHQDQNPKTLLFIGSYTEGVPSTGIYIYELDHESEKLRALYTEDSIVNPSFLKISTNGDFLYAVTKSQLETHGSIAAFKVQPSTGKLTRINEQPAGGRNPVHLSISKDGDHLINSNYTDAGISCFKIEKDGSLEAYSQLLRFKDSSIVKGRQDEAHIHSTNFSPDGNFMFAQDLGADKIRTFAVGTTTENFLKPAVGLSLKTKPGSGPRHFTFHPKGNFGYGIEELSGKISRYRYSNGILTFQQDYPSYANKQAIYRAADIHISPDGLFLYASNRGPKENSISVFAIDQGNGDLKLVERTPTYGDHPRNFVIDPSGKFLLVANQFSNNVVIFKRDLDTGKLSKLPQELTIANPSSLQTATYN
ncbi:lactonase family protein [Sungkyunkwania multivorans]|uniref:Lactonase family protein n=1 Tax=Sungkyunkwania multivorans TaxID=1173618 RepID=A0ABW3CV31_9FLAO